MKDDFSNALKSIKKSLKEDPTDALTWYMKAACLVSLGYDDEDVFDALIVTKALDPELFEDKKILKDVRKNFTILDKNRLKRIFS